MDDKLSFKTGSKKTWTPSNYDGKFNGEVTMLYALIKSLNTVPVRCIAHIGVSPVIEFARKAGITSQYLEPNLSIALGSASVTPLEMAFAFTVFANEGKRAEKPVFIREIKSWTGEVLEKNSSYSIQAIRPETSWTILSMLLDAVRSGTGSRAAIPQTQVFGKTGTTNDFIDAWFVGGVPGLVTSVYAGNDDNKTLGNGQTGGVVSAPQWKEFMTYAISVLDLKPNFKNPSPSVNVDKVSICRTTGFLSVSDCPAVSLYLETGTAPITTCPTHGGIGSAFDENAPRLIRLDQDADLFSYYEQQVNENEEQQIAYEQYQLPAYNNEQSVSSNMNISPPSPVRAPVMSPQTVDERYEQLLKEYGIR